MHLNTDMLSVIESAKNKESLKHDLIKMEKSLQPLLNITYYMGILPDWSRQNRRWILANIISVSFYFALVSSVLVFQLVQLVVVMLHSKIEGANIGVKDIVNQIIWIIDLPIALWILICLLRKRKEFVNFFIDWNNLESQLSSSASHQDYRFHMISFIVYISSGSFDILFSIIEIYGDPSEPYFISYYPAILDSLTLHGTAFFHFLVLIITYSTMILADVMPFFVYNHIGSAIQSLERDLIDCFTNVQSLTDNGNEVLVGDSAFCIWSRFELIADFVDRANRLFGTMILFSHGRFLFFITGLLYFGFFDDQGFQLPSLIVMMGNIFNLTIFSLFSAKVDQSSCQLRSSLTAILSRNWKIIRENDRNALVALLRRLQQSDRVAACPKGLYYITASFLLNFYGLAFSYIIILLQSNYSA